MYTKVAAGLLIVILLMANGASTQPGSRLCCLLNLVCCWHEKAEGHKNELSAAQQEGALPNNWGNGK